MHCLMKVVVDAKAPHPEVVQLLSPFRLAVLLMVWTACRAFPRWR